MSDVAAPAALTAVFTRWIDAIHQPGEPAYLAAAVVDDVRVERHAPAPRGDGSPGELVEVFEGRAAVAAWLARSPAGLTFGLEGEVVDEAGVVVARYWYEVDGFTNGGRWRATTREGRIARLAHQPFALEP